MSRRINSEVGNTIIIAWIKSVKHGQGEDAPTSKGQYARVEANETSLFRDFAKLNKSTNPTKNWIALTPPTHPPSIQTFFGNPSLTWTEHSNHNNQQLLAMHIQTEYTWHTTPKYYHWSRTILGLFSKKKFKRDLDPPTHFHSNLGFFSFLCRALYMTVQRKESGINYQKITETGSNGT